MIQLKLSQSHDLVTGKVVRKAPESFANPRVGLHDFEAGLSWTDIMVKFIGNYRKENTYKLPHDITVIGSGLRFLPRHREEIINAQRRS